MRALRRAALSLALTGVVGLLAVRFAGTAILNALSANAHYVLVSGIAYGDGPRRGLDVYRPSEGEGPFPVIVFFYGGGWTSGERGSYEFVASSLVREGYVVVIPDYRVHPEVVFPAFAQDAAAAVAWTQRTIDDYRGDVDRIVVGGHSAGAYLAALTVFEESRLRATGGRPNEIRGVFGLAGAFDFLPLEEGSLLEQIFPEETRTDSQPVEHVRADGPLPPTLLLHGRTDQTVWFRNSERLAARIRESGGDVELVAMDGTGHRMIVAALAPILSGLGETRGRLLTWLEHQTE